MEYFIRVPLDVPPSTLRTLNDTIGIPVTGVIVNNALPAGLTFKVARKNAPDGIVLAGSPAVGKGGDSLTDFFCPPQTAGIGVTWDIAAPGSFAELVVITNEGGEVSRA